MGYADFIGGGKTVPIIKKPLKPLTTTEVREKLEKEAVEKTEPLIKRYPLNMRTTREVREKLEKAAAELGRSLAQEVEFRLERSFERDALGAEIRRTIRDDVSDSLRREMPLWEERFVKTLARAWSKTLPEFSDLSAKKAKRGRREVSGKVSRSGVPWDRVERHWKQLTGKVKEQWGKLTDDDLLTIEGGRVELLVRKISGALRHREGRGRGAGP